jgi:hypothetical protein
LTTSTPEIVKTFRHSAKLSIVDGIKTSNKNELALAIADILTLKSGKLGFIKIIQGFRDFEMEELSYDDAFTNGPVLCVQELFEY